MSLTDQSILLELHYLPCIHYFSKLATIDNIILEQHENYKKGGYRNRCYIAGANGEQRFSIPLKGGKHSRQPIKKVEIAYTENWQAQHWQSIQSAYGNSPFFEFFADDLKPFYTQKFEFLWDFNLQLLNTLIGMVGINPTLNFTTKFEGANKIPFYECILPKKNRPNIALDYEPKKYAQVFEEKHGFLPNLSIIDLIFCTGPGSIAYL